MPSSFCFGPTIVLKGFMFLKMAQSVTSLQPLQSGSLVVISNLCMFKYEKITLTCPILSFLCICRIQCTFFSFPMY